ncbi:MAG: methyltransferase [Candidatus Thermoplasmatota archaeon]|nr:methyltransferase [Candidatus Thermoplasmatota archaeon]
MSRLYNKQPTRSTTFLYNDLIFESHPQVYEPAEDSFLLLKSIQIQPQDVILELGTGCGLIALECARVGAHVVCTDINPFAVQLTRRNISRNTHLLQGPVEIRHGDLFSVLDNHELFNTILFNPPYLPTTTQEKIGGWFDIAIDGGPDGLRVIRRFLDNVSFYLLPKGSAYFVFSSLSKRRTLEHYLKKQRLSARIVARHLSDDEELDVYCVTPTN